MWSEAAEKVKFSQIIVGRDDRIYDIPSNVILADFVALSEVEGACRRILNRSLDYARDDKVCGRDDHIPPNRMIIIRIVKGPAG